MRIGVIGLLAAAGMVLAPAAHAQSRIIDLNAAQATAALGSIAAGGEVLVRGLAVAGAEVANTIAFRPGRARLRVNTSWVVGEDDARFRLIGVNVDLLDITGNVVASDAFQGLLAGTALSTLEADGLVPGSRYRLRLTGSAVGRGSFTMAIRPLAPPSP